MSFSIFFVTLSAMEFDLSALFSGGSVVGSVLVF